MSIKKQSIPVEIPNDFQKALHKNFHAKIYFEKLPPSHQRAYLEYVNEGKKPETRIQHIEKTVAMLEKQSLQK
jgi:uncharacterized protein YdeI (YjbR/CyaY-like superfamily)